MVILNKNKSGQTLSTQRFSEMTKGYKTGKEIISGKIINDISEINIGPKSAMIIELKPE